MLTCCVNDIAPSLAFGVGMLTLSVPFIIVRATHVYIGGLEWPFVADLSRDNPSSIVFSVGLNVLALLLAYTWMLNYRRHTIFLEQSAQDFAVIESFSWWSYVCNITGAIGALWLPLYAIARVGTLPHRFAGAAFLVMEATACFINSFLSYRICIAKREDLETSVLVSIKYAPRSVAIEKLTALKKAKRGFVVELACSALFVMSLLVYLPIFYQVVPPRLLSVEECVARHLGTHYCQDTVRLDESNTSLWSYEADFAGFQVRAFAQLSCLLNLLTYTLSFVVSNNESAEDQREGVDKLYQATLSPKSPRVTSPSAADDSTRGRRRSQSRPGSPSKRSSRVRSPSGSPPKRASFSPESKGYSVV